ncbi:virulence-associated V antigen [Pseudomonas entomophila]|uniref:virulence-associated V antigen n=1 Tax=Pseudomonas entomophila TaxID=312306 RepID=UPI001F0322D6|nr:virulence-associated V antigen [Pseudomonas entomophila]MCG8291450.1 virulence-associated V antigen [Pseudomonas entomophila]
MLPIDGLQRVIEPFQGMSSDVQALDHEQSLLPKFARLTLLNDEGKLINATGHGIALRGLAELMQIGSGGAEPDPDVIAHAGRRLELHVQAKGATTVSARGALDAVVPMLASPIFTRLVGEPAEPRIDELVIDAYQRAMDKNAAKRQEAFDQLNSLSAESKIYAYIQSLINTTIANKDNFYTTDQRDGGLNNRTLFGYATDEAWHESPEYKLLSNLDTFGASAPGVITIKEFLSGRTKDGVPGPRKESSPVDGIRYSYEYDKDNNPVAAFSQSIGDRVTAVNNKLSQQQILLKDASSRYDTATESLNAFLKKYYDLLSEILRAV